MTSLQDRARELAELLDAIHFVARPDSGQGGMTLDSDEVELLSKHLTALTPEAVARIIDPAAWATRDRRLRDKGFDYERRAEGDVWASLRLAERILALGAIAQPAEDDERPITEKEQAMIDAAWEKHKATDPVCRIPPEGWQCSRGAGHDGPCAATPAISPDTKSSVILHHTTSGSDIPDGTKILSWGAVDSEAAGLREALEEILNVRVNGWDNIWAGADRCREIARKALSSIRSEGEASPKDEVVAERERGDCANFAADLAKNAVAETIERCAQVADDYDHYGECGENNGLSAKFVKAEIAAAIRASSPSDKGGDRG